MSAMPGAPTRLFLIDNDGGEDVGDDVSPPAFSSSLPRSG
jgi:hypothetical protein